MGDTLLTNATIVTMDAASSVFRGDVLISDGTITALGDVEAPDGCAREDCSGLVLIPGFVQTHIHLCQTLMRNCADELVLIDWLRTRIWPYEAALAPDELEVSAKIGLAELLLGGTTTLLDMGTVHHTDVIGEVLSASGIRAFFGKCMMDFGENVPAPLMEDSGASLAESIALAKRWDGVDDGRLRYAFCPRFAVSCTEGLLRDTARAADELGCFVHTHAAETEFENEFCHEHYGCTNMEFLERIGMLSQHRVLAHGVHVTDDECVTLARTGTAIAHCPSSNLKLASGIADIPKFDRHGVKVSLGADGAPCNNNLDAFVEMRLAALLQKPIHGPTAMPAERVLRLATLDGARALGIDHLVGSLEVGKSADIVAIDLDSDPGTGPGGDEYHRIVYGAHRANVRHVWVRGRQLVANSELLDVDVPRLIAEGRRALAAVTERMQQYLPV